MHNEIRMCVGDGAEHVQKQADPRFQAKHALVTVLVDSLALDVLENQIGLAGRGQAGIDQFRYVRMRQPAEDTALAFESLLATLPRQRNVQKLDRYPALEPTVAALGKPDAAHPALADG